MGKSVLWTNARVVTMDSRLPRASAFATRDGMFTAVGSDAEAARAAGPGAEVRDLGGRTVVPGFNDNHTHTLSFGERSYAPNLSGLDTDAVIEAVSRAAEAEGPGRWLVAYGWDYPLCPDPRKEVLDAAFPRNPVVLVQFSGHGLWLNSLALKKSGILRPRALPPLGSILRDSRGEPTGILRDISSSRILRGRAFRMLHDPSCREPRLRKALDSFRRAGITSVQDNTWKLPVARALARLRDRGELSCRVSCWSDGRSPFSEPLLRTVSYDRDMLRPGPVKYFLDGTFSTRTACLGEPYADDSGSGEVCTGPAAVETILRRLARRGRQGAFHIIGDRGIGLFLDAAEKVARDHSNLRDLRLRIEHAQLVDPRDIPRIRDLGILVAAQPAALGYPEKDRGLLGESRARRAYPYRALLDGGVHLSFGSDIPGEATHEPLLHIHLAVNRSGPMAIGAEEALRCYTLESAYAEFQEDRKGCIAPGFLADFTVLSGDPTGVPPGEIRSLRVEATVMGERVVYDRAREG